MKKEEYENERLYWKVKENVYVPVYELSDFVIVNIVIKYGTEKLEKMGYKTIVQKFNELRVDYNFCLYERR